MRRPALSNWPSHVCAPSRIGWWGDAERVKSCYPHVVRISPRWWLARPARSSMVVSVHSTYRKHKLHAICPYFAMFPHTFARTQILAHSRPGNVVLDPFSGRGTTLLESLLLGRRGIAVDINPVAACVTGAKARVPDLQTVKARIDEFQEEFGTAYRKDLNHEAHSLPRFFRRAFYHTTLRELLFVRRRLQWKTDPTDCFLTALVLGSLHGEMDRSPSYLSNQMPRTISPKPAYSLRYWDRNGLWPKRRRIFDILRSRAELRFKDVPPQIPGTSILVDVRRAAMTLPQHTNGVDLIVTSPPYLDVTSYEEDQWLRLWYLGGQPNPTYRQISMDDRHTNPNKYWRFLSQAWKGIAPLMRRQAVIVCRIGGKRLGAEQVTRGLLESLRAAFPEISLMSEPVVTHPSKRQTDSFRPGTQGAPEIDLVMRVG